MAETNSPPQMEIKQITVETTIAANGDREMMFAVAAGVTTRANVGDVPTAGTAMVVTPGHNGHEADVHEIHRHAFCLRHLFIKRAEQQRSIDNGQNGQQQHVENRKSDDLPVRDRQDGAEKNRLHLLRGGTGQACEKQTHACGERQYGSCGDFALRCLFAQCADHQCSAESEHAETGTDRQTQQHGSGRSWQSDVRQRMRGERGMTGDGEVTHHSSSQGDAQAGEESVLS